ncbi:N-acetylmuramic acid 6-phosphate etherase [Devosia aquimaris]|uniref:N-acetylmuramic acid 6-phosphate etherase n=1 Tax=Devosia aquimaris TaxID=2866214 RepID=UPI001CD16F7E|nr:N-acetylmuramic acid 6-phosphate etherase [Devosia sp. CJK-A8-3]
MTSARTEMSHPKALGLDTQSPTAILETLALAQAEAARAVQLAVPEIARAAELAAAALRSGGRLIYAAAGSSGLMALADGAELPGTYGIGREQIVILLAGGLGQLPGLPGGPEDDAEAARRELAALAVGPKDCVIALTASGSTPYPLAAVEAGRTAGAATIGIANNPDVPLFDLVDVGICVATPPEVIAGSTRMGAGTAQKITLNMLSTMVAIHLGHVHDGYMVNVVADNLKLRGRAQRIVMAVAGVNAEAAERSLSLANGAVKIAILLAKGASDVAAAAQLLAAANGRLRPALEALTL